MRVFRRGLILVALLCASAPSLASAAPILTGSNPCGSNVLSSQCQLLAVDPFAATILQFSGSFESAADVALFSFTFIEETRLTVTTSSYAGGPEAGGSFDPTLGLFHADGSILEYLDADGNLTPARFFDISLDTQNYDDHIDLMLQSGSYFLALIATPYGFGGIPGSLGSEFLCDSLDPCETLPGGAFAFELSADSGDGQPAPVPEPGTLALLGTGLAVAIARRRAKRRV